MIIAMTNISFSKSSDYKLSLPYIIRLVKLSKISSLVLLLHLMSNYSMQKLYQITSHTYCCFYYELFSKIIKKL